MRDREERDEQGAIVWTLVRFPNQQILQCYRQKEDIVLHAQSAEEALYSRTKEILSHIVRLPILPECQKNYSRNEISIVRKSRWSEEQKGDEVSYLKSEEYQQFCSERRPTFRITFIGAEGIVLCVILNSDTRRSELLQAISHQCLTNESVCQNAK